MAIITIMQIEEDEYKDLETIVKIRHKFNVVDIIQEAIDEYLRANQDLINSAKYPYDEKNHILYRKSDGKPISIRISYIIKDGHKNIYKTYTEKIPHDISKKSENELNRYANERVKAVKKLMSDLTGKPIRYRRSKNFAQTTLDI